MQLPGKTDFEFPFALARDFMQYKQVPIFDVSEEIPGFDDVQEDVNLHFVLERNDKWNLFRLLENSGVDVNSKNKEGLTPLIFSVMYNNADITEMLLNSEKNRLSVDAQDSKGKTALVCAAERNNLPALGLLLEKGANRDMADSFGDTAVTWSCRLGHASVLEKLLAHEKSSHTLSSLLNNKNMEGRTALMLAVEGRHTNVVKMLLEAGADPHVRGPRGVSLLDIALNSNDAQLVELVAQAVVSKDESDVNSMPGLVDRRLIKQCIQTDKWEGLLTLSRFGFKLYDDIEKNILKRPFPESIAYKYSSTGEDPLDVRLRINPLILALDLNLVAAAKIMAVEKPECVVWVNGIYEAPIMVACKIGNIDLINHLLDRGADINGVNCQKESCAYYAAQNGQIEVVKHLAELVDDQSRDYFVWNCVKGAIQHEKSDLLEFVLRELVLTDLNSGRPVTGFSQESPQGFTALTFAVSFDRVDAFRMLLSFSKELRLSPNLLRAAALNAAGKGYVDILGVLLEYSRRIASIPQLVLEQAISAASMNLHWDALNLLLQSAKSINYDLFELCFRVAADHGRLDVLTNLFDRGSYPNELSKYLRYSVGTGHVEVLDYFLQKGCKRSVALSEFVEAAGRGHTEMVNFLIADASDEKLQSALVSAAREGHWELVNILSANGASIDEALPYFAVIAGGGHVEMLSILFSPDVSLQERESAMVAAATNGHGRVVHFLHENGVSLDCIKPKFDHFVYSNHFEIVKILVESGTVVDLDQHLVTAASAGYGELVRILIGLETNHWRIGEALIASAAYGDLEMVELILANEDWMRGIKPTQIESALKEAASSAYHENNAAVIQMLLQLQPRRNFVFDVYESVQSLYELTNASEPLQRIKHAMNALGSYLGFLPELEA
ncbi:ankyrin repeat domain-containing protein [Ottowia thiooxydans]|uniref:Ankyrin repeat protein n=1 Tax=Ottowia thiooxydans TaxID=219182 RepID=A0ABV2QGH1_9BURK